MNSIEKEADSSERPAALSSKSLAATRAIVKNTSHEKLEAMLDIITVSSTASTSDSHVNQLSPLPGPVDDSTACVREIWASALNLKFEDVSPDDNYFQLGGDSLIAMRIAMDVRKAGFKITVQDVLQHPTANALAAIAEIDHESNRGPGGILPFSLLPNELISIVRQNVAETYDLEFEAIEDIYPCTALQEGLFILTQKQRNQQEYITQATLRLADNTNLARFQNAWEAAFERLPILRTRIAQHASLSGMIQVVVRGSIDWSMHGSLEEYLSEDIKRPMGLGAPLARFALIRNSQSSTIDFVWTMHHALYDAVSTPLILEVVDAAYHGRAPLIEPVDFRSFVRYCQELKPQSKEEDAYWREALSGFDTIPYPMPMAAAERGVAITTKSLNTSINIETQILSVTPSTLIKAAWALTVCHMEAIEDVIVGVTVSGRNSGLTGIESVVGPTIATIPRRIRIPESSETTATEFLEGVQRDTIRTIPYEQTGLQRIRRVCTEAEMACDFQTLLVVQAPENEGELGESFGLLGTWTVEPGEEVFSTYPLTLNCYLEQGGRRIRTEAKFDASLLENWRVRQALNLFGHLMRQLAAMGPQPLSSLTLLTDQDEAELRPFQDIFSGVKKRAHCHMNGKLEDQIPGPIRRALEANVVTWISDPEDHRKLMPIGATGELLIEVLHEDQDWHELKDMLRAAHATTHPSRISQVQDSRVYATGHLAFRRDDGSLRYSGHKKDQRIVHGRKVNLADIEAQVAACLNATDGVVIEQTEVGSARNEKGLVAFVFQSRLLLITSVDHDKVTDNGTASAPTSTTSFTPSSQSQRLLSQCLPEYLIPTLFIEIDGSPPPKDHDGRLDRKCMRRLAVAALSDVANAPVESQSRVDGLEARPSTTIEVMLQKLWGLILHIEEYSSIGMHDNFFRLGGDSITAMKLVAEARARGLVLTVADVFEHPELSAMAKIAEEVFHEQTPKHCTPFSLSSGLDIHQIASEYGLHVSAIENVYPCTPLQEGLFSLTSKQTGNYINQMVLELASGIDITRFQRAWNLAVREISILRTAIIVHEESLLQMVTKRVITWEEDFGDSQSFFDHTMASMTLGTSLVRFALLQTLPSTWTFALTIHHALYDAPTMDMIWDFVHCAYYELPNQPVMGFDLFVKYVQEQKRDAGWKIFWGKNFDRYGSDTFPPRPTQVTGLDTRVGRRFGMDFEMPQTTCSDVTIAALIKAAWALTVYQVSGFEQEDVVFGVTASGRNASFSGIERVAGPTISTLPFRARVPHENTTIKSFLRDVQDRSTRIIPFETSGLRDVAAVSPSAKLGCDFQTLLVIQPREEGNRARTDFGKFTDTQNDDDFSTYPLTLVASVQDGGVSLLVNHDSNAISAWDMDQIIEQFSHNIIQLADSREDQHIREIFSIPSAQLATIQTWNKHVPARVEKTLDETIAEQARMTPDALAVEGFDGRLSYCDLETRATSIAADLLNKHGLQSGAVVPLCFKKSIYTVIAMLAVMKAGCSFVPLDPGSPDKQRKVISKFGSSIIMASEEQAQLMVVHRLKVIVVGRSTPVSSTHITPLMRAHTPEAIAYCIFTTGSTGEPKGIMLSHRAVSTSCHHHGLAMGYNRTSRVLQFASYVFDVSIQEIITTLIFGGCVCVPSEIEKMNSLGGFISSLRINMALLTPTVARLLDPQQLPSLRKIMLGGEKANSEDFKRWHGHVDLAYNGYGPAECAVCCAVNVIDWDSLRPHCLGYAVGGVSWIVAPHDPERLVPLGSVGELMVEGHIVGNGYLADPDRTAASFILPPTWLRTFRDQQSKVYLTGDLVRYNPDGTLTYEGRKDTQVKLHGQRIDLAEVEKHLRHALAGTLESETGDLAVEAITPLGSANQVIMAFINKSLTDNDEDIRSGYLANSSLVQLPDFVRQNMGKKLPPHLIPTACIQVQSFPLNTSGKLDRKQLRALGSAFSFEQLAALNGNVEQKLPPSNSVERLLQKLLATVLRASVTHIGIDDNFFDLGGDSVSAMKLVGEARKKGLQMSVADIFRCPTIRLLSETAAASIDTGVEPVNAFSLLGRGSEIKEILQEIRLTYGFDVSKIDDVYPCTPLQEGVISLSSKQRGDYVSQNAMELCKGVDVELFESSWNHAASLLPIMRTRIVDTKLGLMQVVLRGTPSWAETGSLAEYLRRDREKPMSIGDPLVRYAWVRSSEDDVVHFVWTIHHALYDGVSVPIIRNVFEKAYRQEPIDPLRLPSINRFVKYLAEQNPQDVENYWISSLSDYSPSCFPALPSDVRHPITDCHLSITCGRLGNPNFASDVTAATRLRVAWALVAYHNTGHGDQIFGATVSGRQAPVPQIDEIIGPTLATVPIRIQISSRDTPLSSLLRRAQEQATGMIPFEQAGLQRIAKLSTATQQACEFQTLLVVQPPRDSAAVSESQLGKWSEPAEDALFSTYALILTCYLGDDIVLEANYDPRVLPTWRMERILQHFKAMLQSIQEAEETITVRELCPVSSADLAQVWQWNAEVPQAVDRLVHDIIEEALRERPTDEIAMYCGKEEVTVGDILRIIQPFSHQLHHCLGVREGMVIPILSEKSIWVPIAFISVLKAGAGFLLLDPALPEARLKTIVGQIEHSVLLCSEKTRDLGERLTKAEIATIGPHLRHLEIQDLQPIPQPGVLSAMYAIFTSGSTGVPKGAIVPHRSVATALQNQLSVIGYNQDSRHCDFSAYSFDIAIHNAMAVLITGGVLIIATDDERRMDVRGTLVRNRATSSVITPSNLRPLVAEGIPPTLTSMGLVGEALTREDVRPWIERGIRTFNVYGPSECTSYTTINSSLNMDDATKLGVGLGCRIWVVDPTDYNILVPVGAVGELLIEGHTIGKEYIQDPEKTAAFWIHDPKFLLDGAPGHAARHARIYRSGDLGCYDQNGVLSFVSRKDTQVKIRGQRVELGEVEHHLRRILPQASAIASELVLPKASDVPLLATFVARDPDFEILEELKMDESRRINLGLDGFASVIDLPSKYEDQLGESLPSHMIPSATFVLDKFPVNNSGKTDRKRIKEIGGMFTVEQLVHTDLRDYEFAKPATKAERALQVLWSRVLKIGTDKILLDDNFFRLGGDSISAVKLVGEARRSGIGLTLSVADVFKHPRLGAMAALSEIPASESSAATGMDFIQPYELLGKETDIGAVRLQVAAAYGVNAEAIEDIYPCTPLQEGLIALTSKNNNQYILQRVMDLSVDDSSVDRFRFAWEKAVQDLPILRTRIMQLSGRGLFQIVFNEGIKWFGVAESSAKEYLAHDLEKTMGLGQPLSRYGLIKTQGADQWTFVWTIHHALFDAQMIPIVRHLVSNYFNGGKSQIPTAPFGVFVKHSMRQTEDEAATQRFWESIFEGYDSSPFPPPAPGNKAPSPNTTLEVCTSVLSGRSSFTMATIIRAAWALTVAKEGSSDVVFGLTVSGKNIDIPEMEVEQIVGPTIATIPIRVRVSHEETISGYLERVHQCTVSTIPFEQTGLRRIAKYGPAVARACQFQTLLTVQATAKQSDEDEVDSSMGSWRERAYTEIFSTYALTLVCFLDGATLRTVASFDSSILGRWHVHQLLRRLHHHVCQLATYSPGTPLSDLSAVSATDTDRIWSLNKTVPAAALDQTVHGLFETRVKSQPERPAISAWDAELTFNELNTLSSQLAQYLISREVSGCRIPVIFGKSAYAVISMLAVLKSGNTFVPMDASLPKGRIRGVIEQVQAPIVLCATSDDRFEDSADIFSALKVGAEVLAGLSYDTSLIWPFVEVTSPMYVVFTSGSTGTPKGVVIPHASFASALKFQTVTFGFTPTSRHYDFMSYSFDASLWNTFGPLVAGSCLCIPSEHDRMNNLAASISASGATSVSLTPSVARLIHDELNVQTLALLGEGVSVEDTSLFWPRTRIVNAYGPAECTPNSVLSWKSESPEAAARIGCGVGAVPWVVDPDDHNKLVPVGCVGELLLEGPILGQGYFNASEQTAKAFVDDPDFLLQGSSAVPGRSARMYKTGDLVRYTEDNSLEYLGRKDTQVKMRGQRVELSEVEHHVKNAVIGCKGVVADLVTPERQGASPLLAAFIAIHVDSQEARANSDDLSITAWTPSREERDTMAQNLPVYMVPAAFFLVDSIPINTSGKTDRKRLCQLGAGFSGKPTARPQAQSQQRTPATAEEKALRELFAEVLHLDKTTVLANDNFFLRGGDSISAMVLVSEARVKFALAFSVADVFTNPVLSELAEIAVHVDTSPMLEEIPRFALLDLGGDTARVDRVVHEIAERCQVKIQSISDIYPATPQQEGLMALSYKNPGSYIMQARMALADSSELGIRKFKEAWATVVRATPILRTTIVHHGEVGFVQVVVDQIGECDLVEAGDPNALDDEISEITPGKPLSRHLLSRDSKSGAVTFVWTVHHSLYDGTSIPLIRNLLGKAFNKQPLSSSAPFASFVKLVQAQNDLMSKEYWRSQLQGFSSDAFPPLPASVSSPTPDKKISIQVPSTTRPKSAITSTTVIRAAWALLCHFHSDLDKDIIFGCVISGRNAAIHGIETMIGPTISTLPIRIRIKPNLTIAEFLHGVQRQAVEMINFEQASLQTIAGSAGGDSAQACKFQSLLVVQPPQVLEKGAVDAGVGTWLNVQSQDNFLTYAITLVCSLQSDGSFTVDAHFDSRVIEPWRMTRMLDHFGELVSQLTSLDNQVAVSQLDTVSNSDLSEIWKRNSQLPPSVDRLFHDIIAENFSRNALAVHAWDGDLTYKELNNLSSLFASRLIENGAQQGTRIGVMLERSKWAVIALIGVLRTGGAFVPLDASQGPDRRENILSQAKVSLVVISPAYAAVDCGPGRRVVEIGETIPLENLHTTSLTPLIISAESTAYIIFTSGSTGNPKGVVVPHRAMSSALQYLGERVGFTRQTRTLFFSAFTFDAIGVDVFMTLMFGGCVCIPIEEMRMSDPGRCIRELDANTFFAAPSVLRLIDPVEVPSLKLLLTGGEPAQLGVQKKFSGNTKVCHAYGPTECTVMCLILKIEEEDDFDSPCVGQQVSSCLWIVDPKDHHRLLPFGAVGELLVEGPDVGNGYLDAENTAKSFVDNPSWLTRGAPGYAGRNGRLYKTGDLFKYDERGRLVIIGRKDNQVKIHGQRLELGEIEHHLWNYAMSTSVAAQVMVEIIKPADADSRPVLAGFLQTSESEKHSSNDEGLRLQIITLPEEADAYLAERLPGYMVPKVFFAINEFPALPSSGKTDRKMLRNLASRYTSQELAEFRISRSLEPRRELTEGENTLRNLWRGVLGIDISDIHHNTDFFALGGDSIAAMKLSSVARSANMSLSVPNIFKNPQLQGQAHCLEDIAPQTQLSEQPSGPFSLLKTNFSSGDILQSLAAACDAVDARLIEDAYPCTPLQAGLLALTSIKSGDYVLQAKMKLSRTTDIPRFRRAWEATVNACSILRTRIVQHPSFGLFQVVVNEKIEWAAVDGLELYIKQDQERVMRVGQPLARYAIVQQNCQWWFVWTIHHALYDGGSMPLIMNLVQAFYDGLQPAKFVNYRSFVALVKAQVEDRKTRAFWKDYFEGYSSTAFLSSSDSEPVNSQPDSSLERRIEGAVLGASSTMATIVRAAWSLTLALETHDSDIVFGSVVSGREANVSGIETIVGPTIATVPVRVILPDIHTQVSEFLSKIQRDRASTIPYEQTGLSNICKSSPSTRRACQFQTLLVIQPPELSQDEDNSLGRWEVDNDTSSFATYALTVVCWIDSCGLKVVGNFDSKIISPDKVGNLFDSFESLVKDLGRGQQRTLSEIAPSLSNMSTTRTANANATRDVQLSNTGFVPMTDLQKKLQTIWATVLNIKVDTIGLHDSFFRLGGDSITAMQISAMARAQSLHVSTPDILRGKTIAVVSSRIEPTSPIFIAKQPVPEVLGQDFELAPIQKLFFALQPIADVPFDQAFLLKLNDVLDLGSVQSAFETLLSRHGMLRARFHQQDGVWRQSIAASIQDTIKISQMKETEDLDTDLRGLRESLDIQRGPLVAAALIEMADHQQLFISIHHLVVDLVSWRSLLYDLESLLQKRQVPSNPSISFRSWLALQEEYLSSSKIGSTLPFGPRPQMHHFWDVSAPNTHRHTQSMSFSLNASTTSTLLGDANDAFQTQPVELMLAALYFSFGQAFPERDLPCVFTEGHGRESWDNDIDISSTVGWFTTMFPVQTKSSCGVSLVDAVRETKDCMRSIPGNGFSYFSSAFSTSESSKQFCKMFPVEIAFNYSGIYQQLERDDSLFENLPIPSSWTPESAQNMARFALFDVLAGVEQGCLNVSLIFNESMRHQSAIRAWISGYEDALYQLADTLPKRTSELTLADYPAVFTTQSDLDTFHTTIMPRLGIKRTEEIEAIFPCTSMQTGMLIGQAKNSSHYVVQADFSLRAVGSSSVDVARLAQSYREVVRRHALLRAIVVENFPSETSHYMHMVLRDPQVDIKTIQGQPPKSESVVLASDRLHHQISLYQTSHDEVVLRLAMNHVIFDAHSRNILLGDILAAYGGSLDTKPTAPSFERFAEYLDNRPREEDSAFWMAHLKEALPCLLPKLTGNMDTKDPLTNHLVEVDGIDARKLRAFCQQHDLTVAIVLQLAWASVLRLYTGCKLPVFGVLLSGRDADVANADHIFGPLIGMITCRIDLRNMETTTLEALKAAQGDYLSSLEHQTFSLSEAHHALGLSSKKLFNTSFSLQKSLTAEGGGIAPLAVEYLGGIDPTEVSN